jgi:hypothetical protein
VPRARYDEALVAWKKYNAVKKVREAGLAMIMFGADNDDKLPSSRADLYGLLGPYLRDSSVLDGFTYTLSGGSMASVKNPATTQLGYLDFPDGRAVVFVDGHAQWIPKPPP